MIKAIIFDLGGIIFKEDWVGLDKEFFDKFGISTLIRTQYGDKIKKIYDDALIGKKKMKDVFKEICKQENKKHNIKELCNFYKEAYKRNKALNQELMRLIKKLRKRVKVVCYTDANDLHFKAHKEQGILDLFDEKFASYKIKARKKNPKAFEKILKKLKLKPEEVLLIDNNPENIFSAKSLGIKTILFKSNKELVKELKKFL